MASERTEQKDRAGIVKAAPAKAAAKKAAPAKGTAKGTAAKAPAKLVVKKAAVRQAAAQPKASSAPAPKKGAAKPTAALAPKKAVAAGKAVSPQKAVPSQKAEAKKAAPVKGASTPAKSRARGHAGLLPVLPGDRPWTAKEVAVLRSELESEAHELRDEISAASAAYHRSLQEGDPGTGDEADAGSATFEREHDLSLAANSRDLLIQVERALERLDAGSYGYCETCGNPIGKERLKAFPKVTLCMTCKQRENRR